MKKNLVVLLTIFLVLSSTSVSVASAQASTSHVKRNIATIMFAGLGGAVLGASTLSFYGTPSDHTGNIWLGLAVGLIAGGAYVVNREMQPRTDYGKIQWPTNPSQQMATQYRFNLYRMEF